MMSIDKEPKTFFVQIDGYPQYLGRVIVSAHHSGLSAEIDLLLSETKKIIRHITVLHQLYDLEEALAESMQTLREKLKA